MLNKLAPPQWPDEVFGKIDQTKAAKGAQLFAESCAACRSTWPHRWSEPKKQGKRFIENAIVPVDIVGTDPTQFGNPQFEANPAVMTGTMAEYLNPTFFVRNLEDYETLHEELARHTPEVFFESHPEEARVIQGMRSQPSVNPLQACYWSQTPYMLGPNAIKFSVRPIYSNIDFAGAGSEVTRSAAEPTGPNFLREAMMKQLRAGDVYLEFLVQLQTDLAKMPVEDSLVIWDEALSPFQRVAIIRIPMQDIEAKGRQELAENLSFTPWHALTEQRHWGLSAERDASFTRHCPNFATK